MTIYLAIDPGGTCGMAGSQIREGDLFNQGDAAVNAWQMTDEQCVDYCWNAISSDWVVFMERFFITVQTAQLSPEGSHKTLHVIGTVKHLCRRVGAGFVEQSKNDAAKFVTNDQLRLLGLWRPNEDHARDALRHLAYGIVYHTAGEAREELKSRMA